MTLKALGIAHKGMSEALIEAPANRLKPIAIDWKGKRWESSVCDFEDRFWSFLIFIWLERCNIVILLHTPIYVT